MAAPPEVYDGLQNLSGGMNAQPEPIDVPANQVARAINAAFRRGRVGNRPAFRGINLHFNSQTAQNQWNGGNIQAVGYYAFPGAKEWIIVSIGGKILRLEVQTDGTFTVTSILPDGDPGNDPLAARAYMCQSDRWFIIQDGINPPLLLDGLTVRRASTAPGNYVTDPPTYAEMPIGTFMAYGYGRTWVCTGTREYKASDLIGERGAADGSEVITFQDQTYLAENSSFLLPTKFGPVAGMAFVNQQDTATGQGPLIVFGRNGAEAVNASLPREQWQTTQIQVEALTNIGAQGDGSIVQVNGDLFFRAADGYRSYKQARSEQGSWGSLPMSTAVRTYTDQEDTSQLFYGSAIFFNNRLITTCTPQHYQNYVIHNGLLALDFDPISTALGVSTQPPAWDGYWIPPRPTAKLLSGMFLGNARAFSISTSIFYNTNGTINYVVNGLDEIQEGERFDDSTSSPPLPITTTIWTKAFTFTAPFQEKELVRVEAFQTDICKATAIAVSYRNNGNPDWQPLTMGTPNKTGPNIITKSYIVAVGQGPVYVVDNRSSFPEVSANVSDTRLNRRFYWVQLQIVLTGSQTLQQLRVVARPLSQNERGGVT